MKPENSPRVSRFKYSRKNCVTNPISASLLRVCLRSADRASSTLSSLSLYDANLALCDSSQDYFASHLSRTVSRLGFAPDAESHGLICVYVRTRASQKIR